MLESEIRQVLQVFSSPKTPDKELAWLLQQESCRCWGMGMVSWKFSATERTAMASTALPLAVPSLPFFLLSLSSLSTSPGFCQVVLLQKGQVKQESYTQPHLTSTFLSTSFPPSFFPSFLLPTSHHAGSDPALVQKDLLLTIPQHSPFSLSGPIQEDSSSSDRHQQALSEDCTGASSQESNPHPGDCRRNVLVILLLPNLKSRVTPSTLSFFPVHVQLYPMPFIKPTAHRRHFPLESWACTLFPSFLGASL